MPLGVAGSIHRKVTELELIETISSERGALGTIDKTYNKYYHYNYYILVLLFLTTYTI